MHVFLGIAVLVLAADLVTKWLVFAHLDPRVPLRVIPGCLNFHLSRNPGAVFGIGRGLTPLFVLFTIVAVVAIVWAVRTYGGTSRLLTSGLGLLMGGALGNLWDRIVHGSVRDFIDFYVGSFHWHTFNVADVAICTGCGIIILQAFRKPAATDRKQ